MYNVFLTAIDNPHSKVMGGKASHLQLLEKGLSELSDIKLVTCYPKQGNSQYRILNISKNRFFQEVVNLCVSILALPYLVIKNYYRQKYIRTVYNGISSIDIIHAHDIVSLIGLRKARAKKILTVHGYYISEVSGLVKYDFAKKFLIKYCHKIEAAAVNAADYIIAVDSRIKEYLIAEYNLSPDKITTLFNAVDTNRFNVVRGDIINTYRAEFGISKNDFNILVPRRLVKKNGVEYAIIAMKQMPEHFHLIIAGDGPEYSNLIALQNPLNTTFLGSINYQAIDRLYKAVDAVCIPSITIDNMQEATSLSMLEAMACGKPVVGSNIGGIAEVIENGKNGILVSEKSSDALVKAFKLLHDNRGLYTSISQESRKEVESKYSYLDYTHNVTTIYKNLN